MTQQMQRNFRLASCNALSARYVGVSSLYYGYYYYYLLCPNSLSEKKRVRIPARPETTIQAAAPFQTGGRFLIINFYRRNLR